MDHMIKKGCLGVRVAPEPFRHPSSTSGISPAYPDPGRARHPHPDQCLGPAKTQQLEHCAESFI
eukprot:11455328-Karenia_brevis.AAC.1